MKKILILFFVALPYTKSFANEKTGVYFQANVGANLMSDTKEKNSIKDTNFELNSNKSKAESSPMFILGIGYYFTDFVRSDITFSYSRVNFKKSTVDFSLYNQEDDLTYVGQIIANRKSSIYTCMINAYIDLPVIDNLKVFIGGGIGLAQIREKLDQKWVGAAFEGVTYRDSLYEDYSNKSKRKNNFAYSLTAGTAIKVQDNVAIELAYKWQDFGVTKYNNKSITKNRYNGHILTTGIRFDF